MGCTAFDECWIEVLGCSASWRFSDSAFFDLVFVVGPIVRFGHLDFFDWVSKSDLGGYLHRLVIATNLVFYRSCRIQVFLFNS